MGRKGASLGVIVAATSDSVVTPDPTALAIKAYFRAKISFLNFSKSGCVISAKCLRAYFAPGASNPALGYPWDA